MILPKYNNMYFAFGDHEVIKVISRQLSKFLKT